MTWPIGVILFACVFLNRFGVPIGSFQIPLPAVIVAQVFLVLALQNRVVVSGRMLMRYLCLCICVALPTFLAIDTPPSGTTVSVSSVYFLLWLYSFLVLRPRSAIGFEKTLAIFRTLLFALAICSIFQFVVQFAGLRFFSFVGVVPSAFLREQHSNVVIPIWAGAAVYKSNGIFMSEPSDLSQFLALGLIIEFIYFGNMLRVAVLLPALLMAFSGTGLLVLGFAGIVMCATDRRLLAPLGKFAALGAILVPPLALLAGPSYVQAFARRTTEVSAEGSSGYFRFVTPYKMVFQLASDPRLLIGFGPGTSERFEALQLGINALTKMLIEYGVLGLSAYLWLMVSFLHQSRAKVLSAVGMFWFVFGGGYLLSPNVLFTLGALFIWGPGVLVATRTGFQTPSSSGPLRLPRWQTRIQS
jgi:hypothetical protein